MVAAHAAAHQRRDVHALQAPGIDIDELQTPQILAVDDRQERPGPFRADEHVAERLFLVAEGEQIRDAQIDGHRPVEMRLAADRDPEPFAHRAGKAVAADQIARAQGLGRPAALIPERRSHAVGVLGEVLERHLVAQRDLRMRARAILQDRVEPGLRARPAALRAERRVGRDAERRRAHPSDLVAGKVGDEGAVERPVEREAPVAHLLGDAELAAELHGADAHFEHLRRAEPVLVALDQHRRDAAPAEIGGKRQTDRATADDQHRRVGAAGGIHVVLSFPVGAGSLRS